MANTLAYFKSVEFTNASLEEFVDIIDHYLDQSDYMGDGSLDGAVFMNESENFNGNDVHTSEFDITQFLRSEEAQAAYHVWCKNNAEARVEALKAEIDY
jgi:hypothetical protein